MHQKRTRPETMPAHTHRHRVVDKHTDRQMSADNTAPGFRAPRVLLPPGTRFALPNGVHCSPDSESGEDLSCPQSRCLQRARWPRSCAGWNVQSAPPLEKAFSCASRLPAPSRASGWPWAFLSCLRTGALSALPLCAGSALPPRSRDPGRAPNVMPDVRIPEREERRLPRQCNSQKKGSLLLTRARAPAATNAVTQAQRALSPSCYTNL